MKSKFDLFFNLVQNIFVGLAITITVTLLTTGFTTVSDFFIAFLKAYIINFIACLIVPTNLIAIKISQKLKINDPSIKMAALRAFVCDFIYVTIISVVMFIWNLGFTIMALNAWLFVYLPLLIVGFIAGFIMGPVSMKIAGIFAGKSNDR